MGQLRNYTPLEVTFAFGGQNITGYMDGTFIEVERDEDAFLKLVGSLGTTVRAQNLNRSGKVTLTLLAASPSNDLLNAIADEDERDRTGVRSLTIKDLGGATRVHAGEAWISKRPKMERGKEAGSCVWVFDCADLEITVGGAVR